MKTNGTRYSPAFKLQVVLEAIKAEGKGGEAQVTRAYGVRPATLSNLKRQFLEHGAEVFEGKEEVKVYKKKVAELERMVGHTFGNFIGVVMNRTAKGSILSPGPKGQKHIFQKKPFESGRWIIRLRTGNRYMQAIPLGLHDCAQG